MRIYTLPVALVALLFGACTTTTTSLPSVPADSGAGPDGSDVAEPEVDASDSVKTHTVDVTNFAYTPEQLTINVGDTVEWVWTEGTHTVSSGTDCEADKAIESGRHSAPFTFRHTFTKAGTVNYFCDYMQHCAKGQAGVVVVAAK